LSKNEFRIFRFLRENGRSDYNLNQLIMLNRNITKFSELLLTQDRVAAIGLVDNLESKLSDFVRIDLKIKFLSQYNNANLWIPKDIQAKEILNKNNVEGFNYIVLFKALKHLNFCSSVLLDCNAILYLKKNDLVIAIAPKYKTKNSV